MRLTIAPLGIALALVGLASSASAVDFGTAITFQGSLVKNNAPYTSSGNHCTFTFGLWNAAAGGMELGLSPQSKAGIVVTNGQFSVADLDFGPDAIECDELYLAIQVDCGEPGDPIDLTPRQRLTPAPRALSLPGLHTEENEAFAGLPNVEICGAGVPMGLTTEVGGTTPLLNLDLNFRHNETDTNQVGAAVRIDGRNSPGAPLFQFLGRPAGSAVETSHMVVSMWQSSCCYARFGFGNSGCDNLICENAVCGADPGCCFIQGWGTQCVALAEALCGSLCQEVDSRVGVGTSDPGRSLQVGDVNIPNTEGMIRLSSRSGNSLELRSWDLGVPETDNDASESGYSFIIDDIAQGQDPEFMIKWGTGNVGIGTTDPDAKLRVAGGDIKLDPNGAVYSDGTIGIYGQFVQITTASSSNAVEIDAPVLGIYDVTAGTGAVRMGKDPNALIEMRGGTPYIDFSNDSGSDFDARIILTQDDRLEVASARFAVPVLEIMGGSDLSETFHVSGADAGPGSVVVIDSDRPGELKVSTKPYDRAVAGIISGAGGVKTGMVMGQRGSIADGSQTVALTGRVYCKCDASFGAIAPGDLLTTSSTPGYAMKVTDHGAAHGAVIGKAMTRLDDGQGLILVLVGMQ